MYLPFISGYELGQFVRILLWIFVPVAILSMLVTTWLHYRRRRRDSDEFLMSVEGVGGNSTMLGDGSRKSRMFGDVPGNLTLLSMGSGGSALLGDSSGNPAGLSNEGEDEEYKETVYKGILWMKKKYEQYRDLSDRRYERLKEELAKSEKKYDDLLASMVEVKVGDHREKLLSGTAHAQVEERAELEKGAVVPGETAAPERAHPDHPEGAAPGGIPEISMAKPEIPERLVKPAHRPVLANVVTAAEIERDSLRDLLAERNQQIVFLQRQLDQRIKDFHMAEHEGRGARGQIQELEEQAARTRQRLEEEVDRIRHQLEDEIARGRRQLEEQSGESKRALDEQEANAERKLEEKQRVIADLEEQIHVLRQKIEELVDKLRNNSQLLLNIYQELDKSLRSTDAPAQL